MYAKLNSKELKELRAEVMTDALKQEIRENIQGAFTNELKDLLKKTLEQKFEYGRISRSIEQAIVSCVANVVRNKITDEMFVDLEKKVELQSEVFLKDSIKRIQISAEFKLLKKMTNEIETLKRRFA